MDAIPIFFLVNGEFWDTLQELVQNNGVEVTLAIRNQKEAQILGILRGQAKRIARYNFYPCNTFCSTENSVYPVFFTSSSNKN